MPEKATEHVKRGKHGAKSRKQAIAIGTSGRRGRSRSK
jgi:hypothetical protein